MTRYSASFYRNLDWNLLKTFYEIEQLGGISRACRVLGRKQPALSLALRRLEDQLGITLCNRGPGGFRLTAQGVLIADICRSLKQIVQELPDRLLLNEQSPRERVALRVTSYLICEKLNDAISRFHANHLNAEIAIDVASKDSISHALLREDIDIAIAPAAALRTDLKYQFLLEERHTPYVGQGHRLYGRLIDDPDSLTSEPFILTGSDEPDELSAFRTRHGLGRLVVGQSDHCEGAKRLTLLGVGICFLPDVLAKAEVHTGKLWPLLSPQERPSVPIFIITNPRAKNNSTRQILIDEIFESIRNDDSHSHKDETSYCVSNNH